MKIENWFKRLEESKRKEYEETEASLDELKEINEELKDLKKQEQLNLKEAEAKQHKTEVLVDDEYTEEIKMEDEVDKED